MLLAAIPTWYTTASFHHRCLSVPTYKSFFCVAFDMFVFVCVGC
jgi:hypothetical protein